MECIESAKFITDMPKDCDSCSMEVSKTLIVKGNIMTAADGDPYASTRQIALWSAVSSAGPGCYRDVALKHVRSGVVVREYNFPDAFVVGYNEDFDGEAGMGAFTLTIRQKKDQIEHVSVHGGAT